ncbi:MAG: DNA/RNA nuclease SfsA [Promethearchaeota archaeon]
MSLRKVPLFQLHSLKNGIFKSRPNRFIAEIEYDGQIEIAHIHDPGRLKELLFEGAEVLFSYSKGKLKYYIKAVKADSEWVLIDTVLHNKIALRVFNCLQEISNVKEIKTEVNIGKSRIDFTLDGIPLEVKGVTLVEKGIALFPDAPTERGARHVKVIVENNGIILFLVFRKAKSFMPNLKMDHKFSTRLSEARKKGVKIFPVQISFDGSTIYFERLLPLSHF